MKANNKRLFNIFIDGIVQGVGFRPFVYNYALKKGFKGSIRNTSEGVMIELESHDPDEFINYIKDNCPPLARIYSINIQESIPCGLKGFSIIESSDEGGFTHLSPDISVCSDCLSELFDPADRRYLYPFINCTNCGPRYSIIKKIPYDRPNTTMSKFTMCSECWQEYENPMDRRFHAQPNACHECGPRLSLIIKNREFLNKCTKETPLDRLSELGLSSRDINENLFHTSINILKQGGILAIKGIGGYHLACDAHNRDAVKRLRELKRRPRKPFAVMSLNVDTIEKYCYVSQAEAEMLEDKGRPIVLLAKKSQINLPSEIAPNNGYLGFMLPYTPLHYLLFQYTGFSQDYKKLSNFEALIMTSGNISGEPLAITNEDAFSRLSGIADAFLIHNRDIFNGIDDSVVKVHNNRPIFIRRARGYVPESIILKSIANTPSDSIASGADIKNTFTIVKGNKAIISQHMGDLENVETLKFFQENLTNFASVYRASPTAIAHDMHPGYHSVIWALNYSEKSTVKLYAIQHHHAHIASVMAEKNLTGKIIGVAFDGTGYGTDGNLWGGEFLVCEPGSYQRFAHCKYIPLPGGEIAIRECWRTAISYLRDSIWHRTEKTGFMDLLDALSFIQKYGSLKIENILRIIDNRKFSPLSSGIGRLFDAVSALTGICDVNTFEGESASALESLLSKQIVPDESYPFMISRGSPNIIDFSPMIREILNDILNTVSVEKISNKFHNTLVKVIYTVSDIIRHETGINIVALSGGVFQNKYITERATETLSNNGFEVYFNEKVPSNDGGVSLGQAYILNEITKGGLV